MINLRSHRDKEDLQILRSLGLSELEVPNGEEELKFRLCTLPRRRREMVWRALEKAGMVRLEPIAEEWLRATE